MEILGYSERGVINSLLYEAYYSADPISRLQNLVDLCRFPLSPSAPAKFHDAKVIIEQKFPTFGDADAIFLLDGSPRQCIFVEGKVKTFGRPVWRIEDAWERFLRCLEDGKPESNIFEQLYRKQKLVELLRNPSVALKPDAVASNWTIGRHPIVEESAKMIAGYVEHPWYLAVVPETRERLEQFWTATKTDVKLVLPDWDVSRWGFLVWEDVDRMCRTTPGWPNTIRCLDYNRRQIFADAKLTSVGFRPRDKVNWTHGGLVTPVTFKRRGPHNSRIVLPDGTAKVVPNFELSR